MAGTIPGLALSQQVDQNGVPLAGALLYIFQSGTVATLQNIYSDFGLTQVLPNPLTADQTGRIPLFWTADGTAHARLTDSTGVVILDVTMQVLGPSSGGGGGGGSVDPTTIAATGDIKFRPTTEVLTGWVKMNAQTIGSATSGASQRANSDTQNLFVYLWSNFDNTACPVSGGRGSTALADFNANKTIGLPDWRSRGPLGLDDMGNTAAGNFSGVPFSYGNATTAAAKCGEAIHTLSITEMPNHGHAVLNDTHNHGINGGGQDAGNGQAGAGGGGQIVPAGANQIFIANASGFVSLQNTGGGSSHNNTQLSVLGTWHMKL